MDHYYLHQNFINAWKSLHKPEREAIQALLEILKNGEITPGMRQHQVGSFLSLSPNMNLRVIISQQGSRKTLIYVDHHDAAYLWAGRTRILDGGLGITELINIADLPELSYEGAPQHLPLPIQRLLALSDEDKFLNAVLHTSPEWQEWLLEVYTNPESKLPPPNATSLVFSVQDDEVLKRALSLNSPDWALFLHPKQRQAVDEIKSRTIAITGGPGTGKTIVLLNRIVAHAPKGKDSDCIVLFTYSKSLADHLSQLLKPTLNRHYFILPLYLLAGPKPISAQDSDILKMFKFSMKNGCIYVIHRGQQRFVREILIDELQDAPVEVLNAIRDQINTVCSEDTSKYTKVTLAGDLNQSIHRANQEEVHKLMNLCQQQFHLTYCYRSTLQILQAAQHWYNLNAIRSDESRIFGLSGPKIQLVECVSLSDQLAEARLVMKDLRNRYDESDLAIIYCQYFNPSFNKFDRAEAKLKTDPEFHPYYYFASITKGREFKAGILFVATTFMAKDFGKRGNRLRINTFYVALTRFRDEVTVIYVSECTVRHLIENLNS
jgi:hypothetical protein